MAAELERYQSYRAVSTLAVASFALGLLSVLTFFQWVFAVVPLLAILLGILALRQLHTRSHELTGLPLALAGIILSAVLLPAGWGWLYYVYATEVPPDTQRINYDFFKPTPEEMQRQEFPPAAARALDGQRVFLKGYMFPAGNRDVASRSVGPIMTSMVLCNRQSSNSQDRICICRTMPRLAKPLGIRS